ncbi:MAG: hypothetical protein CME02_08275 [Geminicoccus sp.]|nr:hypothetical protein [Geminicoccus sp.]
MAVGIAIFLFIHGEHDLTLQTGSLKRPCFMKPAILRSMNISMLTPIGLKRGTATQNSFRNMQETIHSERM